jgi:hypothetical protein
MNLIEKSINNKKTTLDKKIYEEYYTLKDLFKPQKKLDKANSKEKEKENFNIITKKNNFISVKKRMDRLIKWYLMSHPNQHQNLKSKRNSISETKLPSNDKINNIISPNSNNNINANSNLKKNQSEGNLKNCKNENFNISPISTLSYNNNSNNDLSNNFVKKNDQVYFNDTLRLSNLTINNPEISRIENNKKVEFMLENESERNNQNSNVNVNVNLNNRFKNMPACNSNWSSLSNNVNSGSSNHEEIYNFFLQNQNKHFFNDNSYNNTVKLSSTLTMPNLGLNKNINNNNYIENTNSKIKLSKTDASIKIIPKADLANDKNTFENLSKLKTINNNHNENNNINNSIRRGGVEDASDYNSSRNADLKKTSTSNTNANSNTLCFNNPNNNSADYLSSNKSNIDKFTSAHIYNSNKLTLSKTINSNSNTNSQNAKEDSNPNCQHTEKNNYLNNLNNSSQDNNEINSNSILLQQLNIFDDSNIIDSNLRLFFKLNKDKFLNRVAKGPPASFRWISWLISCNLPFERPKDFYAFLLSQQLNSETDIQIKKDLNRTLSGIKITNFIIDDSQLILYNILKAFALVDTEVSYCQGMNFIVGFLLVISDFNEIETFYFMLAIFSNTFKENLGIRGFFLEGFPLLNFYVSLFLGLFSKTLPELKKHFEKLEIPDEVWISKWFRTLFTLSLPFEFCMQIWDCLVIYGLEFLLNFSLAFMKYLEPELLKKQDLFDVIEFFKKMSPFFAMENEGEEALIAESNKFIEALNIEEIIANAKKIKISAVLVQEQMKLYEQTHKINFRKLKVKYDLGFQPKNENSENFNFYCESNINKDDIKRNSFIKNNGIDLYTNKSNDEEVSMYSMQCEKSNCDFYINTDTCRSVIEKIKNNLEPKNSNLNSSSNNLHAYNENNMLKLQILESNRDVVKISNINFDENEIIKYSSYNIQSNNQNNSGESEHSPTNSDTDLIADDIQDKITNYTFKPRFNIIGIHKRFDVNKDGKIE